MERWIRGLCGLLMLLTAGSAEAQLRVEADSLVNPWTHLNFKNDPDDFQFVIVADHTGGPRPGIFEKAVRRINLLQPEFVISVGDLIQGYTEDAARLEREWEEFQGWVQTLNMPFFYVPGNHDIHNSVQLEMWKAKFGRSYYHFVYKDVLFLVLDTEDPPSMNMSDEQIAYAEQALKDNSAVRWTLAFLHRPVWAYKDKQGLWARVEGLLQGRPHTVFAGHFHRYLHQKRHNREYYTLATTGGSSRLTGVEAGQFDHVVWVTMTDKGPLVANLLLDGILEGDVRNEYTQSLTDPLFRRQALLTGPLFVNGAKFPGGRTTIRFRNPGDVALKARAAFEVHEDFRPAPRAFDLTVPPGGEEEIEVRIDVEEAEPVSELAPLFLAWTLEYDLPGRDPLRVEGKNRLAVERLLEIRRIKKAPVIDGNLEEWKALPVGGEARREAPGSPRKSATEGPRFAVGYDDSNLYLGVRIVDERLPSLKAEQPGQKAGVLVYLDGRAEPERAQSQVDPGQTLNLRLKPGRPFPEPGQRTDGLPQGLRAVCASIENGLVAEVAVPAAYLDARQGRRWEAVRLNVAVHYFEEDAWRGARLWWRPDWRSAQTYAGSGTFLRK